jgi:hypothetical protein
VGAAIDGGEFAPGIGGAHVDNAHRRKPWPGWFHVEQARGLAAFYATPEFSFDRQQHMLVKAVGRHRNLDPLAAAGDDGQGRTLGVGDPHVVLELSHMFGGCGFLGKRPWEHEFGFEH